MLWIFHFLKPIRGYSYTLHNSMFWTPSVPRKTFTSKWENAVQLAFARDKMDGWKWSERKVFLRASSTTPKTHRHRYSSLITLLCLACQQNKGETQVICIAKILRAPSNIGSQDTWMPWCIQRSFILNLLSSWLKFSAMLLLVRSNINRSTIVRINPKSDCFKYPDSFDAYT